MPINAFDTPDQLTADAISAAQNAGYIGAGRYISGGGAWKHLTQAEINLCKAAGFGLWLIDEATGDMAQFKRGEAGGAQDGNKAAKAAHDLGVPAGLPIFVGVDYGAGEESVGFITAYMKGYKSTCVPYRAGMYADGLIASAVPTDVGDFVPGASGWPGTKEYLQSGKIALVQHPPIKQFGLDVDPVEVIDRSVLWFPRASASASVAMPNAPTIPSSVQTMQMPKLSELQELWAFYGWYDGSIDNHWGPKSAAALAAMGQWYAANS